MINLGFRVWDLQSRVLVVDGSQARLHTLCMYIYGSFGKYLERHVITLVRVRRYQVVHVSYHSIPGSPVVAPGNVEGVPVLGLRN